MTKVILLDLNLPKIDVLQSKRAHEQTRLLPVVVLTSLLEDRDHISNGYSLGANSYVRKPVDFLEFVDAVQQLDPYWLILNQPPPRQG